MQIILHCNNSSDNRSEALHYLYLFQSVVHHIISEDIKMLINNIHQRNHLRNGEQDKELYNVSIDVSKL